MARTTSTSSGADKPYTKTSSATVGREEFLEFKAGTSREFERLHRHMGDQISSVRSEMKAARTEMKGELATVMAEFRTAEANRATTYSELSGKLQTVTDSLPSTKTIWRAAGATFLGLVATAALAWAIFDTGAGITSSFADQVLEDKTQQERLEEKLDKLLEEKSDDQPQGGEQAGKTG